MRFDICEIQINSNKTIIILQLNNFKRQINNDITKIKI